MYRGASIGDYVWLDADRDGQQEAGETGVNNVTVRLLNAVGATIATTTTDASGFYSFTGLQPGTYSVEFVKPSNYGFTTADQGSDTTDSDANVTTGRTGQYTLVSGQAQLTVDAGLVLGSIGNYVWRDLNANGVQDANEIGVDGVTVRLLNSSNVVIATTTTANGGAYLFSNLSPGTYTVEFVKPSGFYLTVANAGGNDSLDSDASTTTGHTGTYTLAAGEQNLTVDAGLVGDLHGLTGTIGFWANNNGQQMIKLLNVTSTAQAGTSTALGNWLASNFPNIYGISSSPNYFAGKTTAYIASRYVQLFNGSSPKTDAQFLALCFAIYTTTKELNSVAGTGLGRISPRSTGLSSATRRRAPTCATARSARRQRRGLRYHHQRQALHRRQHFAHHLDDPATRPTASRTRACCGRSRRPSTASRTPPRRSRSRRTSSSPPSTKRATSCLGCNPYGEVTRGRTRTSRTPNARAPLRFRGRKRTRRAQGGWLGQRASGGSVFDRRQPDPHRRGGRAQRGRRRLRDRGGATAVHPAARPAEDPDFAHRSPAQPSTARSVRTVQVEYRNDSTRRLSPTQETDLEDDAMDRWVNKDLARWFAQPASKGVRLLREDRGLHPRAARGAPLDGQAVHRAGPADGGGGSGTAQDAARVPADARRRR
jgi:hypothetical protein